MVAAIADVSPALKLLLDGFVDERGHPTSPAVLLVRSATSADRSIDLAGITAFRNAVAAAYILIGRARMVGGANTFGATWSDLFDLHPTTLAKPTALLTHTPALTSFWPNPGVFVGQPNPYLPVHSLRFPPDLYLARSLAAEWGQFFVRRGRKRDAYSRTVFRSLELFYAGASTPWKQQGSLEDYGLQTINWVSAIEVLAQPAKGNVKPTDVLQLLAEYRWTSQALRRRKYKVEIAKKIRPVNAIQKLYMSLYNARSKFVHGDDVGFATLAPRIGKVRPSLLLAAALVYRTALVAYLRRKHAPDRDDDWVREMFDNSAYDRALESLLAGEQP